MSFEKINAKSFYIVLMFFTCSLGAFAQPSQKPPVFVLIHGAFHGGWCWQRVSKQLRAKGDIVYTPTLSGQGEHKNTLNSRINLDTHITDIVNLIVMEDLHNVILVGHSYAGAVIAGVADRIPERLSKLVFLDALLVRNGQSANDTNPEDVRKQFTKAAIKNDNGLSIPYLTSDIFGVSNSADIRWTNARLTNQPYRTFSQPLKLTHPYGNHLPLIYIACTKPELRAIKPFADEAKASKGWKYLEIQTGHDAMITAPAELTTMLQSFK